MAYEPKINERELLSDRNRGADRGGMATAAPAKEVPALERIRGMNGATLDRLRHGLHRLDLVDERLRVAICGPVPKNVGGDKPVCANGADMSLGEQADLGAKLVEQLFHLIDRLEQHAG